MKVAFGLKAHSGWAALVVVGRHDREFQVVTRRRIELVEEEWAKQPYHAAEELEPREARQVVKRGVDSANRISIREIQAAVKRERELGNEVTACAVIAATNPMPDWSVDEILAVHFRMHKAEGVLFREALLRAAEASELRSVGIPENLLMKQAEKAFRTPASGVTKEIAKLGKAIGPPWGKDQKDATLAAVVALQGLPK